MNPSICERCGGMGVVNGPTLDSWPRPCPSCKGRHDGHTISVGYVHTVTKPYGPCTPTCPHPDHKQEVHQP